MTRKGENPSLWSYPQNRLENLFSLFGVDPEDKKNGSAGTRTLNQRVKSALLYH